MLCKWFCELLWPTVDMCKRRKERRKIKRKEKRDSCSLNTGKSCLKVPQQFDQDCQYAGFILPKVRCAFVCNYNGCLLADLCDPSFQTCVIFLLTCSFLVCVWVSAYHDLANNSTLWKYERILFAVVHWDFYKRAPHTITPFCLVH